MGRTGALLRSGKKQSTRYTFTGEELEEHDRQVIKAWRANADALMRKHAQEAARQYEDEVTAEINKVWDERKRQFKSGGWEDTASTIISYTLALSCRVLIEQFGWKPPNTRGRHTKIMHYADALTREIGAIGRDSEQDIVRYAEETKRLYDLSFEADDAEEE